VAQQSSSSRRRLQWTLGTLAAIPVASAAGEILRGPQGVPGGSPDVIPTVDSSLRYANVFKFAVGPVSGLNSDISSTHRPYLSRVPRSRLAASRG